MGRKTEFRSRFVALCTKLHRSPGRETAYISTDVGVSGTRPYDTSGNQDRTGQNKTIRENR